MFRIAMTFRLKPGAYAEYKRAHDDLWPEVARSMSDNDVNMAIYHYQGRLFLFATAPTEAHWQRSREAPILAKWMEYMATVIVTDGAGKLIVEPMEEAFVFGSFAD